MLGTNRRSKRITMQELKRIAERVQKRFKLPYNDEGVKFLEVYIEYSRTKVADDEWVKLINSCGAFLGQSIIAKYGGRWVRDDKAKMIIELDAYNKISPFEKVIKQFNNGLADSVHTVYMAIPEASAASQIKNEFLSSDFPGRGFAKDWADYLSQMYLRITSFI
jgi:hypothetical protein